MTPIYGLTEGGVKKTGRDPRVLPRTVIYDPELTLSLPVGLSVTSGINAIAHAAEGLYAHDGNPIDRADGRGRHPRARRARCRRCTRRPQTSPARGEALYGAWLCGAVLGNVAMGAAPQAVPHARRQLQPAACRGAHRGAAACARLQRRRSAARRWRASRGRWAPATRRIALQDLARRLGAPTALRDIGMPADGLDRAADLAASAPYPNPRPLERDALRALLQRAFEGAAPSA